MALGMGAKDAGASAEQRLDGNSRLCGVGEEEFALAFPLGAEVPAGEQGLVVPQLLLVGGPGLLLQLLESSEQTVLRRNIPGLVAGLVAYGD